MPSEPGSFLSVTVRPPGAAPYAVTLERLTDLVRVYRMGRLANALGRALDAKAGLETAVERDVAKYIDRVEHVHERRQAVFARKHAELDLDVSDLAEFEKDLEDFGKNDRSRGGESTEPPPAAKPQQQAALPEDGNAYSGTTYVA
jgi:hypothetical protein